MVIAPTSKDRIFSSDILVFSAHKTATQTITNTLSHSDIPASHGHTLANIGLTEGGMGPCFAEYLHRTGRRLTVISVFREPLERMVSSFFQSLEKDYYARTRRQEFPVDSGPRPDTFTRTPDEFASLLCSYIEKVDGFGESIDTLMSELRTPIERLSFSANDGHGQATLDTVTLFLFRFDQLIADWGGLRVVAHGKPLRLMPTNIAADKPHAVLYADFVRKFRLSKWHIEHVYQTRRHLIDLFYPGCYSALLDDAIRRHGVV